MAAKQWVVACSAVLLVSTIFFINWEPDRTEFWFIATCYIVAFGSYLTLISNRKLLTFKQFVFIAIGTQLASLLFEPNLSIDYYRFLWDGEITWSGYNPFDYTPQELFEQGYTEGSGYLNEIYTGIGSLSQSNYSCYPPINQLYFTVATAFSDSIVVNTIILKLLIISTELVGAIYLRKLLMHVGQNVDRMWILFLNPLWIIECTGNVHFEGVMISLLFVALYFLMKKNVLTGGTIYALAVQIKLVPLMLLPFFLRFLGWWKAILLYTITITLVVGLGFIQLDVDNITNFGNSLRLYFQVFEFNSFILHHYVQIGIAETGWNMIRTYGPYLSKIAVGLIMMIALYGQIPNWKVLFKRMTLAYFAYLMLSSTLHPWYMLPMLALSLFTNYGYPLVWSFLIFFSYIFYTYESSMAPAVRNMVNIEYVLLIGVFVYEIIKGKSFFKFLHLEEPEA
ncbi:MAG: hypothetical protein QNK23_03300 [Crocinitomicaceae bacterium]|nr:hypothetical protein [Crocinitomicaceae bacterium]